jgi:hypothetical protein
MKKMIRVLSALIDDNYLQLHVNEQIPLKTITPKEQMLVDSAQFAFVYILEMDEEYTYLVIHEDIWPILKKAQGKSVVLMNEIDTILLPMFSDELTYLIENIKGNNNYGEEMVGKVEKTFQDF